MSEELKTEEQVTEQVPIQEPQDEVTTTSIAKEEEKTGTKVEITEEQMLQLAAMQHLRGIRNFGLLSTKVSARGFRRVVTALLQMPNLEDGGKMKNYLKDDIEKELFNIGQQTLSAKYGMMLSHIKQEKKAAMAVEVATTEPVTEPIVTTEEVKAE